MKTSDVATVLFLSYNGLLEPILASQGIPYLEALAKRGFKFILLTYEKKCDVEKAGRTKIEDMKADLARRGIEWIPLRYHKKPRLISTLYDVVIGAFVSFWLIHTRGVKLVHLRGVTPGTIMILLSGMVDVKVLFDMRGRLAEEMAAGRLWKSDSLIFRLVKMAEERLLKTADAVSVLTHKHFEYNEHIDYFKKRMIPKEVIPCCVDTKIFSYDIDAIHAVKKELKADGAFILMYQGKLGTFYFIEPMFDFYRVLLARIPDAVFVILTPDDQSSIIALARSKGIDETRLRIFRGLPFSQIPRYLQVADAGIFFINSHEKLGSSPIKMGEFLSCGVPVIINPGVGDTEDTVREDHTGVIVDDLSYESYCKAVSELMLLIKERDIRKRCRQSAIKRLSLEEGIEKYYSIYRSQSGNHSV